MKQPTLALEITPEQVSSIQILKGKQLHITLDELTSIGSVLKDYQELISKFIEDNMAKDINIIIKDYMFEGIPLSVIIISINETYVN
jgi:hypothetical protein